MGVFVYSKGLSDSRVLLLGISVLLICYFSSVRFGA
jgi:hypothetical protein